MLSNQTPLTIAEAARLLETRQISPVALVEDCLRRIDALDAQAEAKAAEAKAAEVEIRAGRSRGPLHGIPIAFKDIFETAGAHHLPLPRLGAPHPHRRRHVGGQGAGGGRGRARQARHP